MRDQNNNKNNPCMNITEGNFTWNCQTELNWQLKECVFLVSSCALVVKERLRRGTLRQYHLFQIHSASTLPCIFPLCFFLSQLTHL